MRKFIISDIHGNGDIYDSIMGYLENISLVEDVTLYINGDLIDRGLDSFRILEDVMKRMNGTGKVKIHYLGGNHELMMYQALKKRKPGKCVFPWCDWLLNGGWVLEGTIDGLENGDQKFDEIRDFVGELNLYHIFDETIGDKKLLLVHAQAPKNFTPMKIGDDNRNVFKTVWTREKDEFGFHHRIGKDGFFTIVGHTPVLNDHGFSYHALDSYLNIDGGCAGYAIGEFQYKHVPLVEVKDDQLEVLVFNHNNEIIKGYRYDGKFHSMTEEELDSKRIPLNHQFDGQEETYKEKILEVVNA